MWNCHTVCLSPAQCLPKIGLGVVMLLEAGKLWCSGYIIVYLIVILLTDNLSRTQ